MTTNGNMYQGAHIDPMCIYGSGITAEDCAIFKAISEGQTHFKALCVHVKHLVQP